MPTCKKDDKTRRKVTFYQKIILAKVSIYDCTTKLFYHILSIEFLYNLTNSLLYSMIYGF